jgi:hypothetical protein
MLWIVVSRFVRTRKKAPRFEMVRGAFVGCHNSFVGFYLSPPSGARATPRNASPARAERIVTNVSR